MMLQIAFLDVFGKPSQQQGEGCMGFGSMTFGLAMQTKALEY
jgi:hypothetical protein